MTNSILCISFLGHCMIENQQTTERFCLFAHLFNSRKPLWIIILIPKKFCAWHIYSCCHNWRKNIEIRIVFLVRPSEGWGQVFLHFLKMTHILTKLDPVGWFILGDLLRFFRDSDGPQAYLHERHVMVRHLRDYRSRDDWAGSVGEQEVQCVLCSMEGIHSCNIVDVLCETMVEHEFHKTIVLPNVCNIVLEFGPIVKPIPSKDKTVWPRNPWERIRQTAEISCVSDIAAVESAKMESLGAYDAYLTVQNTTSKSVSISNSWTISRLFLAAMRKPPSRVSWSRRSTS